VMFYVLLTTLPYLARFAQPIKSWGATLPDSVPMRKSSTQQGAFIVFLGSMWYVCGTLPCARFYYEGDEGFFGNVFLRVSYQFLYAYLAIILHWLDKAERSVLNIQVSRPSPIKRRKASWERA
jgi:hypothetical protein